MEIVLHRPQSAREWLLMRKLYRDAFPRAERKPFGAILRIFREGRGDIWCIRADGKFAGMATTVNGEDRILLDYFAVVKSRRGKGIGSGALECLLSLYGDRGVFLEIENPETPGLDRDLRKQRKVFYLSAGLKELGVRAKVFGVKMELLGIRTEMNFRDYRRFYQEHLSPWAADHLEEME